MRTGSPVDVRPAPFRWACHGAPDRCLKVKGKPMWLCARCTGFYAGSIIGALPGVIMGLMGMRSLHVLIVFILSIAPMAVDGMTQFAGWRTSNNVMRLATGLLAGSGGGASLLFIMVSILIG
ncbi:MAG: DUF2085 domain-containing protein [Candidatus Thermoplasmatota archaeon]|nr:DUF2085 domain-containing protein [Candidatus Thermoplasmatota archaeon]